MTPQGVRLDIRLTHEVLAAVTGARRPSVSTALKRLTQQGRIQSRPRSRWLLLGQPPAELHKLHEEARRPSARQPNDERFAPQGFPGPPI